MIRAARERKARANAGILAEDIMVRRLHTAKPDQSVQAVVNALIKHRISGMPVVDAAGKLVGMISEKDCINTLIRAVHDRMPPSHVSDVMTTPKTIGPGAHLMTIAHHFSTLPLRRLPVVDGEGKLVGQISRRDLLKAARQIFDHSPSREVAVLYLSALERDAPPLS
ncbi:MAG: CBS-domain-containing membrane protein [Myxococcota bacterium]|jgi:CBS-domain-containing membrane protein